MGGGAAWGGGICRTGSGGDGTGNERCGTSHGTVRPKMAAHDAYRQAPTRHFHEPERQFAKSEVHGRVPFLCSLLRSMRGCGCGPGPDPFLRWEAREEPVGLRCNFTNALVKSQQLFRFRVAPLRIAAQAGTVESASSRPDPFLFSRPDPTRQTHPPDAHAPPPRRPWCPLRRKAWPLAVAGCCPPRSRSLTATSGRACLHRCNAQRQSRGHEVHTTQHAHRATHPFSHLVRRRRQPLVLLGQKAGRQPGRLSAASASQNRRRPIARRCGGARVATLRPPHAAVPG